MNWTTAENDAIVAAYLMLLSSQERGEPIVKADVIRALRAGPLRARSKGSVEFKFQNISAVLAEAGRPWVRGYKPMANVQELLRVTVLRALESFVVPARK